MNGNQMSNGNSIHYSYDALERKHGKRIVTLKASVNVPMGEVYSAGYYSSGIQVEGHQLNSDYAFGGKELQSSHAVNLYDFEARYYDPVFGFTTMDPLCEKYYGVSPYSYCAGNPVSRIDPNGGDWYEDKYCNAFWKTSREPEYRDDNGTVWSNIGTEYLLFNGNSLYYFQQQENEYKEIIGLLSYFYGAVSGRAQGDGLFSYSEENQAQKNTGPIPSGLYSINPQEIQNYNDLTLIQKACSLIKQGPFPGGTIAWWENRVWITPTSIDVVNPVTGQKVTRTNMSIHGGASPGSARCIDLYKNAPAFFDRLSKSSFPTIRLNVLYQPYNQTSQIWRKK